jgi:hypothetical protein
MSASEPGGGFGTVFHPEPEPAGNGPVPLVQLRPLPRRRRPGMIALAVALVGAGILGSAWLYHDVNHQVPVLMITKAVPAGSQLTTADLATTTVAAGPGVQTIPARQESQVVGLVAASTLKPGTLLAATELTRSLPPAAGQALVPVAVKPAQLPASGLAAGDHLLVVPTPSGSAAGTPPLGHPVAGVVEAVSSSPDEDGLDVVDLLVPAAIGPSLAQQAATGDIALVVTSRVP